MWWHPLAAGCTSGRQNSAVFCPFAAGTLLAAASCSPPRAAPPLFFSRGEAWGVVARVCQPPEGKEGEEEGAAHQQQLPRPPPPLVDEDEQAEPLSCRFCFGEDEQADLVSPCKCVGTQRWVHSRCLSDWQTASMLAGHPDKALCCDVCTHPFTRQLPPLTLTQRLRVCVSQCLAAFTRLWLHTAALSASVGLVAGASVGLDYVCQGLLACVDLLDSYEVAQLLALDAAVFYAAPLWVPAAGAAAYAVIVTCTCAGGVFGLLLGIASGPVVGIKLLFFALNGAARMLTMLPEMGARGSQAPQEALQMDSWPAGGPDWL